MKRTRRLLALPLLLASAAVAQQYSFTNSGGIISLGSNLTITGSALGTPAGTYSFTCPVTALPPGQYSQQWLCNGGSVTIQSNDGLTTVDGVLTSGTLTETAAGGGRGGHVTYSYSFSGNFTGSIAVNGQSTAILGATDQSSSGPSELGTGTLTGGSTSVNARYEPLYVTDTYNYRIVRMDDIYGDNLVSLGTYGSGVRQFGLPWGLAVDHAGRIYVTDSANCRVVRMNGISGAGWTSLGSCGSGSLQFNAPAGIAVDSSGRIWVADAGNNRIVRFNDMTGSSWAAYGALGTAAGQFHAPSAIALDSAHRIYVADQGNSRIVRFDNLSGANWTALGSSGSGVNQFNGLSSLSLDTAGRLYVADTYNNRIVRIDDMSGANWTVLGGNSGTAAAQFLNPYGASVDPWGTIYVADSRDYRIAMADDMTGSFWTTYSTPPRGWDSPTTIVPVPPSSPVAAPTLSATKLAYANTVVGTSSSPQTVTLNIGSAPLDIDAVTVPTGFSQTNTCGTALPAGATCVFTIAFTPAAAGPQSGSLAITFASGPARTIALSGLATLVSVSPLSLAFGNVNAGGRGASLTVTVANPGSAPAALASIVLTAPPAYRLQNPCPAVLSAGAACTLTIRFFPPAAGVYNGLLTVTDGGGAAQKVGITGTGVSN